MSAKRPKTAQKGATRLTLFSEVPACLLELMCQFVGLQTRTLHLSKQLSAHMAKFVDKWRERAAPSRPTPALRLHFTELTPPEAWQRTGLTILTAVGGMSSNEARRVLEDRLFNARELVNLEAGDSGSSIPSLRGLQAIFCYLRDAYKVPPVSF